MGLVITRNIGESIVVLDGQGDVIVRITPIKRSGNQVRVYLESDLKIRREEIHIADQKLKGSKKAIMDRT